MTLRMDVLLAILGMALATYLCRAGGYALFRAFRPPRAVEVALQHLPGPIFVAYVAPALAMQGMKGFAAAAVVVVVQAATRNLAVSIFSGVAAIWAFGLVV